MPSALGPPAGDFASMTLKVEVTGEVFVRSVELISREARVRFSFPRDQTLEEGLCHEAARAVRSLMSRSAPFRGILSLPEERISLPGLVLSNLRIISTDVTDGGRQIMIRFGAVAGDFMAIFAATYAPRSRISGVKPGSEAPETGVDTSRRVRLSGIARSAAEAAEETDMDEHLLRGALFAIADRLSALDAEEGGERPLPGRRSGG